MGLPPLLVNAPLPFSQLRRPVSPPAGEMFRSNRAAALASATLGVGAFGEVFRGVDAALGEGGKRFAVKRLSRELVADQAVGRAQRGFRREVDVLSAFKHPHIITLLAYVQAEPSPAMTEAAGTADAGAAVISPSSRCCGGPNLSAATADGWPTVVGGPGFIPPAASSWAVIQSRFQWPSRTRSGQSRWFVLL